MHVKIAPLHSEFAIFYFTRDTFSSRRDRPILHTRAEGYYVTLVENGVRAGNQN